MPPTAKQLSGKEIPKFLHGKKFSVVIYDADAPIEATANWDWNKKRVYGDFVYQGSKGSFDNAWIIKGNESCGEKSAKGALICQKIFIDGKVMYEVNRKGKVHAVSKPAD